MQITFNPTVSNNNQKRQTFGAKLSGKPLADSLVENVQKGWFFDTPRDVGEAYQGGRLTKSQAMEALGRMKKLVSKDRWGSINNAMDVVKNA